MLEVPVYDANGKQTGKEKVDPAWFGGIVRKVLLHDALLVYQNNKRAGTHNTKRRGEVEGSTKKPWKQKHTGRARAGTKRSPLWRHGGIVFGPHPRDYSGSIPKQMKHAALDSALLSKFEDGEAALLDGLKFEKPQTSKVAGLLEAIGIKESVLIGTGGVDEQGKRFYLSARNIRNVHTLPFTELNALDILKNKRLLLTRDAFNSLVKARKEGAAAEPAPHAKEKKS